MKQSGEVKGLLGSWRVEKQKKEKVAEVPRMYGGCTPPEWKLQMMYKQLKTKNSYFTTWLVESLYPNIESLPYYITLSEKQPYGKRTK